MARKKYKNKKVKLDDANVNITPLLDVLTVLLFFLITSLNVNSLSLETTKGIRLPAAVVEQQAQEAIQVSLSEEEIRADGKVIMNLTKKGFNKKEIGEDGRTLIPFKDYLEKQLAKKQRFYGKNFDLSKLPPNQIIIQADKDLKFKLVKYMLHTIAVAGYVDYQFVVIPES